MWSDRIEKYNGYELNCINKHKKFSILIEKKNWILNLLLEQSIVVKFWTTFYDHLSIWIKLGVLAMNHHFIGLKNKLSTYVLSKSKSKRFQSVIIKLILYCILNIKLKIYQRRISETRVWMTKWSPFSLRNHPISEN